MLHQQKGRKKKSFALEYVGSSNFNLEKGNGRKIDINGTSIIQFWQCIVYVIIFWYVCLKKYNYYVCAYVWTYMLIVLD